MGKLPDGKHKKMEKYILRKAFDVASDPYLPEEVLWRQKEQFSDGVGYDWVDGLRDYSQLVGAPVLLLPMSLKMIPCPGETAPKALLCGLSTHYSSCVPVKAVRCLHLGSSDGLCS